MRRTVVLAWVALLWAACSDDSHPVQDAAADVRQDGSTDADGGNETAGDLPQALAVSDYCEEIVDFFCPFYLRCGRIAEADLASCKSTFLETCNAIYEPNYLALAEAGYLALSAAGIAACRTHLETVPCDQQLLDLEGPCKKIWRGLRGEGQGCGPSYDTFVCQPGLTCVVTASFCGTCEKAAATTEACGEGVRCVYPDKCVDGFCAAPAVPGQGCGDQQNCISGARCESGVCAARIFAAVGEGCDSVRRCQYRSVCLGGKCVRTGLLGDSCSVQAPCASGRCDTTGHCVAFKLAGQTCSESGQCLSLGCGSAGCESLLSSCL